MEYVIEASMVEIVRVADELEFSRMRVMSVLSSVTLTGDVK